MDYSRKRQPSKHRPNKGGQYNPRKKQPKGGRGGKGNHNSKYHGRRPSGYHGKSRRNTLNFSTKHDRNRQRGSDRGGSRGGRRGETTVPYKDRMQKYLDWKPMRVCKHPSKDKYHPKSPKEDIFRWMNNWDLEALASNSRCYKCTYYGHYDQLCEMLKNFSQNLINDLYYFYKHKEAKRYQRKRRERRHANVAQENNQTKAATQGHVNSIEETNKESLQQSQDGSPQANMILSSQQTEQPNSAQVPSYADPNTGNINQGPVSEYDQRVAQSILQSRNIGSRTSNRSRYGTMSHHST